MGTLALRGQDLERGFVFPVRGRDANRDFRKVEKELEASLVLSLAELDARSLGVMVVWTFPAPPRPDTF
jgi:hypothetical protein